MEKDLWKVYSKRSTKDLRRMWGEKYLLLKQKRRQQSWFATGEVVALERQMTAIDAVLAARASQAEFQE